MIESVAPLSAAAAPDRGGGDGAARILFARTPAWAATASPSVGVTS